MHKNILNEIRFKKIISNRSVHGLVWSGIYKNSDCVIKMVVLKSGKYPKKNPDYFKHNDIDPFSHKEFRDLKPMSEKAFLKECTEYSYLSKLKLSPIMYGYWITETKNDIRYGFIVNEQLDCSIKDILLKRELNKKEKKLVDKFIDKLHDAGIAHGDLKPSNIGVYLNSKNEIEKCYALDCQKVTRKKNLSKSDFEYKINRDNRKYKQHVVKNIEVDRFKKY